MREKPSEKEPSQKPSGKEPTQPSEREPTTQKPSEKEPTTEQPSTAGHGTVETGEFSREDQTRSNSKVWIAIVVGAAVLLVTFLGVLFVCRRPNAAGARELVPEVELAEGS